ncbi:MAG: imidazole glycerol phosphate synthase subunit HisF [Treponema sp.]|nr:imidazole glycerol phosphate synthase subunit HisF [Treponema sp.]
MQYKKIIAALDISDNGRVIKGVKFEEPKDIGDPAELAKNYNDQGADELAFLDINASFRSRAVLLDVVRRVAGVISVPLSVAGGINTIEDVKEAMKAGANKVSVCSSALARPEFLAEMAGEFGRQCVVLSIDAKRIPATGGKTVWHAFTKGGRIDTGLDAVEWAAKAAKLGAGEIILNSIDADGTGAGYDLGLCSAVVKAVEIPVIASSGAGTLEQIEKMFRETGAAGALVASMLHFKKTTVGEIKKYLESKGISVKW